MEEAKDCPHTRVLIKPGKQRVCRHCGAYLGQQSEVMTLVQWVSVLLQEPQKFESWELSFLQDIKERRGPLSKNEQQLLLKIGEKVRSESKKLSGTDY